VPVLIVGGGAIGSLFGFLLARAGTSVLLAARPETAAAIQRDGLRVEGRAEGTARVEVGTVVPSGTPMDLVLLAVPDAALEQQLTLAARGGRPVTQRQD